MPRLTVWSVLAGVLLTIVGFIAPEQLPVVIYKEALVTLAVVLGYWLDRALFPYARPHELFDKANGLHGRAEFYDANQVRLNAALATLRRALIVLAVVLGMTLGL